MRWSARGSRWWLSDAALMTRHHDPFAPRRHGAVDHDLQAAHLPAQCAEVLLDAAIARSQGGLRRLVSRVDGDPEGRLQIGQLGAGGRQFGASLTELRFRARGVSLN